MFSIAALLVVVHSLATAAAQTAYVIPFADGSGEWESAYSRAKNLVSQMTLEEKLNITQQSISNAPVGAVSRLGYTGLFYADGSEGIRGAPFASAFDMALNAAGSWDRDLMYRRAQAIGNEARGKGIHVQFGPGVNLMRTPQAGRGFEYNGPDPYLAGAAARQHVMGMQSSGVQAMVRHYIGNEEETGRQWTSSNIDDRTAHELYVWPFQDALHAGCVSVMCSYNGLNGTYSCANPVSLGKWLHEELNFQGWVLSDYGAVYEGTEISAANSGLDSVIGATTLAYGRSGDALPNPFGPNSTLSGALQNGSVTQDRLDDMVTRIVSAWYQVGQDKGYPTLDTNRNVLNASTNDLIRELGAKSIVLLKNEKNALPLQGGGYISVFGQASTVKLDGYPSTSGFGFSPSNDPSTFAGGFGSSYANLPYLITLFEALQTKAREMRSQVNGYFDNSNHTLQASYAATTGNNGGACIVDLRSQCGEGFDRANLSASFSGEQTVLAVASTCNNTVVVYSSCGPFDTVGWYDHPNVTAILDAGGLGQESGNAVVDVLFGCVNPSAKLPYTLAANTSDFPARVDTTLQPNNVSFINVNYTEGLLVDYRWFDQHNIQPIYEFGFGLSYTTFKITNIAATLTGGSLNADEPANSKELYDVIAWVSVDVCNTGSVYGTEIPQLYVASPAEGAAPRVLRGFDAAHLNPGETKRVTFELTRRDLSYWNVYIAGWTLPQGQHTIYVGNSSRNVQQSANITLSLS